MIDEIRARFRTRFLNTARQRVRRALGLLGDGANAADLAAEFHTLAGEAAMLEYTAIADEARSGERAARAWASGQTAERATCARALRTLGKQVASLTGEGGEAEPAPELGATNVVVATAVEPGEPPGAVWSRSTSILVIDDSALAAEQIADGLIGAGIEALTATDPATALDVMRRRCPRLVVTDVNMPGVDLAALVTACREAATARIVVLLLSGLEPEALAARARAVGADGYLTKQRGAAYIVRELRMILEESFA